MTRLAIFASGSGTNAENVSRFFRNHPDAEVKLILTNKKDAGVILRSEKLGIPCIIFDRKDFYETDTVLNQLKKHKIDFIILAGFLWLVPDYLLKNYPGKIINIHPALLPKYGGKGMYGQHVHETVLSNHETESGITIHFVNEHYDAGDIIFQARCSIDKDETPESLAMKVHELEYEYFPKVIEKLVKTGKGGRNDVTVGN